MNELLFAQADLSAVIRNQEQKLTDAIAAVEANRLLNTSLEDLAAYFEQEFHIEPVDLLEDGIQVDQNEAKVDVSGRFDYMVTDRTRPAYVPGTNVTYEIPFTGDENLFKCRPSTFNFNPPRANVRRGIVKFTYSIINHDAEQIKREFERDKKNLSEYLGWIARDIAPFNSSLRDKATRLIESRREKLMKD